MRVKHAWHLQVESMDRAWMCGWICIRVNRRPFTLQDKLRV